MLFGPLTCDPGVADDPAPLGWALCDAALEPVAPVDAAPAPLLGRRAACTAAAGSAATTSAPWARASPPERTRIATVAPRRFDGRSPSLWRTTAGAKLGSNREDVQIQLQIKPADDLLRLFAVPLNERTKFIGSRSPRDGRTFDDQIANGGFRFAATKAA